MQLSWDIRELRLRESFAIARWSYESRHNVFVRLEHEGMTGYGEAAPNARYGDSAEACCEALAVMAPQLTGPLEAYDTFLQDLWALPVNSAAAKAAVDMAVMDWIGKKYGLPLHRLWGLDPAKMPPTSMTIGLADPAEMARKARAAERFAVLKIKLGSDDDRARILAIRDAGEQRLRVDVNEAWRDREQAAREIAWLANHGVELVEQPMPADQHEDMVWLKARSVLPLFADESFHQASDVPRLAEAFHGINLKLAKSGGTLRAREAITLARVLNLKIMIGCMVESSLAVAAAAHLGPLADFVDLDGDLLLADKPFEGLVEKDGIRLLDQTPGLGVEPT